MNKITKIIHNELKKRIGVLDNSKLLYNFLIECIIINEPETANYKAKAEQLISAHRSGAVEKLLTTTNRDKFLSDRLIENVIDNIGYERNTAEWIIDVWSLCIDEEIIDLWNKYKIKDSEHNGEIEIEVNSYSGEKQSTEIEMSSTPEGLLIPCGVGYDDRGFYVCGIKETPKCNIAQESIYAVIFNYLQRNSHIDEKSDKPYFIKEYEESLNYEIDYRNVYRLMMIILLMIKNNYLENYILAFDYDGKPKELEIAYLTINNYAILIGKLVGAEKIQILKYIRNPKLKVAVNNNTDSEIFIVQNRNEKLKDRIIWFAPRINYKITRDNKKDLEYFLKEISDFDCFREGQFESLQEMLNAKSHKLCIMPTGSGKSLIYYLCTLLQPGIVFVIAPTELLISDQINNLKKIHKIDDSKALKYNSNFTDLDLNNKIYYLTPETFQNRDLLKEFIHCNATKKISNIILDEVHCISNWSHDFRPEYLMLSTYLNRYLDRTYFLCFTATANYSVIRDIEIQLNMEKSDDIISPIKLEKDNINFKFVSCDNFEQMAEQSLGFLKKGLLKGQKTLVFTKSEKISDRLLKLLDDIKYEVEIYREDDKSAYRAFADGRCRILMASEEIGIGINLSDVHNILHFGLPISKGEYVQEIGRAGRNGEQCSSLVVYMRCNSINIDERLFQRTTETSEIIQIINNIDKDKQNNDYIDIYRRIIGETTSQEEFSNLLHKIFNRIKTIDTFEEIDFPHENINQTKKALYILFAIGYINNWSLCDIDYDNNKVTILVGLRKENIGLGKIKESAKKYLYLLGNDRESIINIGRAASIENIVDIYNNWYYNHFIYHHKEQFLDMLSFFESYKFENEINNRSSEINSRLAAYFSLSMLDISQDEAKYVNLSFRNIIDTVISGVEYSTISNIQRINQDKNNIKLDYFLFVYSVITDNEYDTSRMKRIISNMSDELCFDFIESLVILYNKLTVKNRLQLFKDISTYVEKTDMTSLIDFFNHIFRFNSKDIIYYGVLAKKANIKLRGVYNV